MSPIARRLPLLALALTVAGVFARYAEKAAEANEIGMTRFRAVLVDLKKP